jgi:bifunctional non-homologous end joining protein LigD
MAASDKLAEYRAKRNFKLTSEPRPRLGRSGPRLAFVIQKHWATRLHYDFRLELNGTLLSWAVPKGPSLDPGTSAWPCTWKTIPLATAASKAPSPLGSTAPAK